MFRGGSAECQPAWPNSDGVVTPPARRNQIRDASVSPPPRPARRYDAFFASSLWAAAAACAGTAPDFCPARYSP